MSALQVFYKRNYGAYTLGINVSASRVVSCSADKFQIADAGIKKQSFRIDNIVIEKILEAVLGVADAQQGMQIGRAKIGVHENNFLTAQSHSCRQIGADNTFPYAAFSASNGDYVNWACHCVYALNELGSIVWLFMLFLVFQEYKRFQ